MNQKMRERHTNVMKRLILLCLFSLWIPSPAFPLEETKIPCEVLEVSGTFHSSCGQLNGISYILLHHAINADRETISKWLKTYSGKEVRFIVKNKEYKGILCRLAHCFGRGLLIYTGDVRVESRDIIEVILTSPH